MIWTLLWWLILLNGNTALGVAIINRLHGLAMPDWLMELCHQVHYVLLIAVPAAILYVAGWGAPLWQLSTWSPSMWLVWGYFLVCCLSTVAFWGGVFRRRLRPTPPQQIAIRTRQRDLAAELGRPPFGRGPWLLAANLPGNQIFRLEIVERDLVLPHLPHAWNGLSILHFSDVHFVGTIDRCWFERVLELGQQMQPDIICFTGDLLDNFELLDWLPATLGRLRAPLGCHFVLGNHDCHFDLTAIRDAFTALGWHDVATQERRYERDGQMLTLEGSEYPWVKHDLPPEDIPSGAFRILLSHTPDNLNDARREGIQLVLAGHVHGGQIQLPVIGPVYCPSRFGCYYAEGLFHESPTLMHVSRGLAGRAPVRLGCLPEITKLTLRRA